MKFPIRALVVLALFGLISCGGSQAEKPGPEEVRRPFLEFLNALENTLVEVNELERMGGGIRDRMILVDAESLVEGEDEVRLSNALRLNYGKIRSLRASVQNNRGIGEVLSKNGHSVSELVAIDAKREGVVILYLAP